MDANANDLTFTNGLKKHKLISAATTNATLVKGSKGRILTGSLFNTAAATKYFKLYNKAVAPTVGTDVPEHTIAVPPSGTVYFTSLFGDYGYHAGAGLAYAITGASGDSDTTAVAAGDVIVNLEFV